MTSIDREIVRRCERQRPSVMFLSTASGDAPDYCRAVERVYGHALRCQVEVLALKNLPPRGHRPRAVRGDHKA